MPATVSALTFPELTAFSLIARDTHCDKVGGVSLSSSDGRLRCAFAIPVGTKYGHSTEHATCCVTSERSWHSDSVSDTTACFDTLYGPIMGGLSMPAIDAVLTIYPR